MKALRMTTAQALVTFLNQQYIKFDGKQERFIKRIFTIFGHGNVVGLGQVLEEDAGELEVYQGRNEQGRANAAMAFANQIPLLLLPGDVFTIYLRNRSFSLAVSEMRSQKMCSIIEFVYQETTNGVSLDQIKKGFLVA